VAAAEQAWRQPSWRGLRPDQRAEPLHALSTLLLAGREELARLQMRDNGKPLAECRAMVTSAAKACRYYAGVCETLESEVTPPRGDYCSLTVLEPYGVVGLITPWNSPIMTETLKLAPALAAGNAVVLKPSEETPLTAPRLMELCLEAGIPPGVVNLVQGPGETIGAALVRHPGVAMISFTGGSDTGRAIGAIAGQRLIPAALELGGKSPHIVFADAKREHALAAVLNGIFSSSGQSCIAGSRLLVERSLYRGFVDELVERTRALRVGPPEQPTTQVGPLASFHHRDQVAAYVELGRREGARVLCGGSPPADPALAAGAYYLPTILEGVPADARVCQEEIFGPVLVALPFDHEDDLIAQANGTVFGLAAGVWTEDFAKGWRVARALAAGSVWLNTYKQSSLSSPFGGFKASGLLREKGIQGVRLYSQVKSLYLGLHQNPPGWAW